MDITNQRRCLLAIAVGLFVGTAGAIGWSLRRIDTSSPVTNVGRGQQLQPAVIRDDSPPFDERLAAQSLRGPLYDPAPPPKPRPKPKAAPTPTPAPRQPTLGLTLVGTIIETDQSVAILSDASGQFDVKGIGESLELLPAGVTVQSIESEQVTLQYQGRQSTVQLDRSTKKSGAGGVQRGNNRRKNR